MRKKETCRKTNSSSEKVTATNTHNDSDTSVSNLIHMRLLKAKRKQFNFKHK